MAKASAVDASGDDSAFLKELGLDKCVFCQSAKTRRKVLFCLHLSCAVCLSEHLTGDNTVFCARCQVETPDPGPGRKLLESLADWPNTSIAAGSTSSGGEKESAGTATPLLCQDPYCDDYVAANKCVSCDLLLCDGHSASHGRDKRTSGHTMEPISPSGGGNESISTKLHCQLHTSEKLIKFCSPCKTLVCAKCCAKHSSHEVLEVEEAAEQYKERLVKVLDEEDSAGEGSILRTTHRVKQIAGEIDTIDKETTALSEAIAEDFQKCHELLTQREEEVKADLDKIRWQKVKPLEERKQRWREQHGRLVVSKILLSNLNPVPLLRACRGLEESISADVKPSKEEEASEAVTLSTTLSPYSQPFQVDLGRARILLGSARGPSSLPSPKPVTYCNRFDPARSAPGITLSKNNQVATACDVSELTPVGKNDDYKWQVVCSIGSFKYGCVEFAVQLLEGADLAFVGVCYPSSSMVLVADRPEFQGWAGYEVNIEFVKGGALGQPWEKNDIIKLKLDLDAKKLTAVHQRTGSTESLAIADSQYYTLGIDLDAGGSVRLLLP